MRVAITVLLTTKLHPLKIVLKISPNDSTYIVMKKTFVTKASTK